MKLRTAWLLALAALTPLAASAVELQYRYEAGETVVYRDWLAMAFEPRTDKGARTSGRLQYRSNSLLKQEVKKADGEAYTIETSTIKNSTVVKRADGTSETKEHLGDPERVRLTRRGSVLERQSLGKDKSNDDPTGFCTVLDEFGIVQQIFDGLLLPEGDVEPGHTWTDTITVDLTQGTDVKTPVKVACDATFVRLVTIQGHECAEIITDFTIPMRAPESAESREMNLTIKGNIQGHLTSYFGLELGRSVVELATLGVDGMMTISPPGAGGSSHVGGRLKVNLKTVLEQN